MLAAIATFFCLTTSLIAGPPLICHAFDIGNAKSLPWVSHDWNLSGSENYDTHHLANDTLAVLNASQVPLVHMETLRRAPSRQNSFFCSLLLAPKALKLHPAPMHLRCSTLHISLKPTNNGSARKAEILPTASTVCPG
jgi:hypothetical protein